MTSGQPPSDFEKHYSLGLKLRSAGIREQDTDKTAKAVTELRKAVILAPENAEAHRELGWALYGLEELHAAKKALLAAVARDPNVEHGHLYLGCVLSRLELDSAAEASFRRAIKTAADKSLPRATFAETFLWRVGRYQEAEENFRLAIDESPGQPMFRRDYARMLASHGRDDEASRLFKEALALDPGDSYSEEYYNHFLSRRRSSSRDPRALARAALEKDPSYKGARALLLAPGKANIE